MPGSGVNRMGSVSHMRFVFKFIWRCAQFNQNASCATKPVDAFLRFETTCRRIRGTGCGLLICRDSKTDNRGWRPK